MRILDVGCGLSKYKRKYGDVVIGLDLFNLRHADVIHDLNVFPYPFKDNEFDIIWCNQVLEHLNNPVKVIEEFWRITKPEGKVFINVPHYSSFMVWSHIDHKRGYSVNSFNIFRVDNEEKINSKAKFKVKSELKWLKFLTYANNVFVNRMAQVMILLVDAIVNYNFKTQLVAERFLCYLIGGFDVVEVELEVVK